MDQDYERRLLRQINVQNDNASPIVSVMFFFLFVFLHSFTFDTIFLTIVNQQKCMAQVVLSFPSNPVYLVSDTLHRSGIEFLNLIGQKVLTLLQLKLLQILGLYECACLAAS